jgi:hypothetical protein
MQKTILYLAILAILGFGVWFFLFSDKSGQLFSPSDAAFTIRDTGSIGKIFISANDNPNTITLERKSEGWVLNNKYPVLQSTLRQLLRTLYQQKAAHPVPDNNRDGVIRSLIGGGIKTEVYDRDGNKMRTFFVGGEVVGFAGTAMLMAGSERPYVVQIPGFDGYLTTRYTTDLNQWRDRIVFDLEPDQIEQVSIRYAQEPLNSFTLTQQDGKVSVALDTALHYNMPLNERRARGYLTFFSKIYSEGFATGMIGLDSLVSNMPEKATIDLRGKGGYHQQVKIIYFPIDRRSKQAHYDASSLDDNFHADRYFAILNGGKDTATVQVPTFEKIFRRGYEFFIPDEAPPQRTPELPAGLGN